MNAPFQPLRNHFEQVAEETRTYEVIDNSALDWHIRTRSGLPFQLKFCREGYPSHFFRTREAALAAAYRWVETGRTS